MNVGCGYLCRSVYLDYPLYGTGCELEVMIRWIESIMTRLGRRGKGVEALCFAAHQSC